MKPELLFKMITAVQTQQILLDWAFMNPRFSLKSVFVVVLFLDKFLLYVLAGLEHAMQSRLALNLSPASASEC